MEKFELVTDEKTDASGRKAFVKSRFNAYGRKEWAVSPDGKIWKRHIGDSDWNEVSCKTTNPNSYPHFTVHSKPFTVHETVAKAFVPGWFPGAVVDHKNGDRHDNRSSNLEWVSQSVNCQRKRKPKARERYLIARVDSQGAMVLFESQCIAAAITGVSQGTLSRCLARDDAYRSLGGYQWFKFLPAEVAA